jgi:hypothetical protein
MPIIARQPRSEKRLLGVKVIFVGGSEDQSNNSRIS